MQYNSAVLRRTCGQAPTVESKEGEFLFVERVQRWMEGEDSSAALLAGYGLCGLTALYLLGGLLRVVIG